METTERLVIVSNRLPMTARIDDGVVRLPQVSGGLATGLQSWRGRAESVWVGWPGDTSAFTAAQRETLDRLLAADHVEPVYLSGRDIERYYDGFCNRVVWPLFHYLIDRIPVDAAGWENYQRVNEQFADAVVSSYRAGDLIWVHDYQLMLVPALLRERVPDARIGFFLHIPFPSSEVFRILPWRGEILRGLLGADLVGFHTFAYLRHFVTSLLHIEGIEAEVDAIQLPDRRIEVGVFPMGVDAHRFEALARDPSVQAEADDIRRDAEGRRIVLGVDRLDYTKGIPRRLLAIERLLTTEPAFADSLRYIQIAVPSREGVDSYQAFKRQVEEAVGRINGRCATLRSTPVHYLHRSVSQRQLVALFCAADVMIVTPLRDGMNLVAKEFVASRPDEDGILVLSEFAGAAAELGEALVVNPYDVDALTATLKQALLMKPRERRTRMQSLRHRVLECDVHRWATRFLEQLQSTPSRRAVPPEEISPRSPAIATLRHAPHVTILLDYDGTLVPIAPAPALATPDAPLLALLAALAARPNIDLHLVSGRPPGVLDEWLADLPVSLWAEHGFWHRASPDRAWESAAAVPAEWLRKLDPILEHFAASTPGSLIERKSASVAWHYRIAHAEFGRRQAHELRMLLGDALSNQPLEVLEGRKVIEVRLRGVTKARAVHYVLSRGGCGRILAIGDDKTDEDLFAALPEESISVAVGTGCSRAQYRLRDYRAVRTLLESVCFDAPA